MLLKARTTLLFISPSFKPVHNYSITLIGLYSMFTNRVISVFQKRLREAAVVLGFVIVQAFQSRTAGSHEELLNDLHKLTKHLPQPSQHDSTEQQRTQLLEVLY